MALKLCLAASSSSSASSPCSSTASCCAQTAPLAEWHKLLALHRGWRSSNTYTGSMQTQDPLKATGKLHPHGSGLPRVMRRTACIVLKEATKVSFKRMGDLASVWCELEL